MKHVITMVAVTFLATQRTALMDTVWMESGITCVTILNPMNIPMHLALNATKMLGSSDGAHIPILHGALVRILRVLWALTATMMAEDLLQGPPFLRHSAYRAVLETLPTIMVQLHANDALLAPSPHPTDPPPVLTVP